MKIYGFNPTDSHFEIKDVQQKNKNTLKDRMKFKLTIIRRIIEPWERNVEVVRVIIAKKLIEEVIIFDRQ
jgi:hypothetical protein